tara:strand:- start:8811 stop:11912 length:3102 start_codon:yes stop_codon:yes gene_type:complete
MKNKILSLILITCLTFNFSVAQKCASYEHSLSDQMQKYPDFYNGLVEKNAEIKKNFENAISKMNKVKTENGVRIIPVVVHVIHDLGSENISDASIQNAIDILNANINGQGANFLSQTPDVFAKVRGEAKVEFRLAKKDPDGLPTTGINRVRSSLTNQPEPRDAVKALSYWNSYQYFNIWTVKQFAPQGDGNILLGYAQFPYSGSMSTDGVVLLASQMVSGGTLTHEVGHWLGLRHTWGDTDCGDDGIKDTPTARGPNYGISLNNFPYHVGLAPPPPITGPWGCVADSLNPAGEMFVNYMDYSSDAAVTMFTKGQVEAMNVTLNGELDEQTGLTGIGFREYMWSEENLDSTGTSDGYQVPTCTQQASFKIRSGDPAICEGETIILEGNKNMFGIGNVSSFIWDFGDGNFDNSGNNFITHTYNSTNPQGYDITLTVEYDEVTESRASNLSDLDLTNATSYDSIIDILIVQGSKQELQDMGASNVNVFIDQDGYSLDSYWKNNQFTTDSLVGAFTIDTFNIAKVEDQVIIYIDGSGNSLPAPDSVLFIDDGDSTYIHIDGSNALSSQDLLLLESSEYNADSSEIYSTQFIVDYLDSIVDYNFYYDTTVHDILTYIDSTYLTASDSNLINGADSVWFIDGILNNSDSVRIYYAQYNMDTTITISVNTDNASLSAVDSLMFNDADSTWQIDNFVGWVDTVRTYYGKHYYTRFNGYYADTMFYRGNLAKKTYVAYFSNSCTSTFKESNYLKVFPSVASSNSSSYSYSFEDALDLNADWVLSASTNIQSPWSFNSNNSTSWQLVSGTAAEGSSSIKVDGELMQVGVSTEIISKAYNLSAFTQPVIKFSWAGAAINTFPSNELLVTYSDDCGKSWKNLGSLDAVEASNAGLYVESFKPLVSEWNDTIMYDRVGANALKSNNIRFKFEYVVNGSSNNFYLDNIQIGELSNLNINELSNARVIAYPNPANNYTTLSIENLADRNIEITLMNVLGAEVSKLFKGNIVSNYQEIKINLGDLRKGVYFINVETKNDVISTKKLIIE